MAHMLTINDLEERPEGTYYTGPLEEAKEFIRAAYAVTESSYWVNGKLRYAVMFALNGEQATWGTCNDYGVADSMDGAWRFALGGEFGPADDEFSAFPLTTNKTEAVRTLVAHHFPKDQRQDVLYSTTGQPHAVVIDETGMLWKVHADGTLDNYRA